MQHLFETDTVISVSNLRRESNSGGPAGLARPGKRALSTRQWRRLDLGPQPPAGVGSLACISPAKNAGAFVGAVEVAVKVDLTLEWRQIERCAADGPRPW